MPANLIYIMADQLGRNHLGYAGAAQAKTPNIDRLAAESADLCNAVSGHPVCAPYRASLMTGKYTPSTGMVVNELRINPNHRCFAHVLNDAGYDTSYIGKWHLYADQAGYHYSPSNSFVPPGPDRLGFDGYFAAYNFHHEYYGAAAYYHLDTPEKVYCNGYEPDVQTGMAIERLRHHAANGKSFALFLSLGTPHDPWDHFNVPGEYLEKFKDVEFALPANYKSEDDPYADKWGRLNDWQRRELTEWMRVYYAMTANLDDNVGRLLDEVKRLGLNENTIVVFTSDHGEMFGAQGRRAKNTFYDEAVRVPFLIRQTGRIAPMEQFGIALNAPDIMPTLLSLMGQAIPESVEGYDFSAPLLNERWNGTLPGGTLMMGTGAVAIFEDGHEWRAWHGIRFTYAEYLTDGAQFLFDNFLDPLQMNNLAHDPAHRGIAAECKAAMYQKMEAIGDRFLPCSHYKERVGAGRRIL
jgi:arylsulfatase A-like enzyme